MKKIVEASLANLESRLQIRDEFIAASILDPGQVNSALIKSLYACPLALMKILWEKYELDDDEHTQPSPVLSQIASPSSPSSPSSPQAEPSPVRLFLNFLHIFSFHIFQTAMMSKRMKLINKHISPATAVEVLDLDVEFYQYLNLAPSWSHNDVSVFWKAHRKSLPKLFKIARIVLAVSATSVICERAFSIAGIVVNKQTSSLHHVTVHRKLFVHHNYPLLLES